MGKRGITKQQFYGIKRMDREHWELGSVARKYGVTVNTVREVSRFKTWPAWQRHKAARSERELKRLSAKRLEAIVADQHARPELVEVEDEEMYRRRVKAWKMFAILVTLLWATALTCWWLGSHL